MKQDRAEAAQLPIPNIGENANTEPNREEPVVVIIAPNKDAPTSIGWGGTWNDSPTTTMHLGVDTYSRAAINGLDCA